MLPSFSQMLLYGEPPSYLKSLESLRLKITRNRYMEYASIACCVLKMFGHLHEI